MNILRRWIRYLFGFSRRETNGFLILAPLMLIIIFSEPVFEALTRQGSKDFTRESVKLDSLVAILESDYYNEPDTLMDQSLSPFNPNSATRDQLQTLGFNDELINRITNYRAKGGKFFVKSDILKIYGMDSSHYEKLRVFIQLPAERGSDKITQRIQRKVYAKEKDSLFDLNTVDSAGLIKIYGIGPVLSSRIVRFRDKLGGFIKKSQLNEVYGLDSSVVVRLSAACFIQREFKPRLLKVNQLSENELSTHPYLSRPEAKAIVAYRFQHGPFLTVQDICKIQNISEETCFKIKPYLTVD